MMNRDNEPSLVKKITFSYFPREKRSRNVEIRKRWEDKIQNDIETLTITNWRRQTLNRDQWQELINRNTHSRPVNQNIKNIIYEYKDRATERRAKESAVAQGATQRKVTEVLTKNANNKYECPGCRKCFKPHGISKHVKAYSDAKSWRKKNRIK